MSRQALCRYRVPCRDTCLIRGFSLVEVLVTIVILLVGLLGLAGLQGRALTAQMESYQRSQALVLMKDMANRINANRANAATYVTTGLSPAYLGTGSSVAVADCTSETIGKNRDFCEWNNALLGAAETQGTSKVGAMIGARGCIEQIVAGGSFGTPGEYRISVAWQGINSTAAPTITCGQGAYGADDALRRVVSLPVSIAYLSF